MYLPLAAVAHYLIELCKERWAFKIGHREKNEKKKSEQYREGDREKEIQIEHEKKPGLEKKSDMRNKIIVFTWLKNIRNIEMAALGWRRKKSLRS